MKDVVIGILITVIVMFIILDASSNSWFERQAKTGIISLNYKNYSVVPINLGVEN